jgi:hypothetical protein
MRGVSSLCEERSVAFQTGFFAGGDFVIWEDGANWARGFAGATVDAFIGVDVELRDIFEALGHVTVGVRVDTVHRTDVNTGQVFGANAGAGNHAGHME